MDSIRLRLSLSRYPRELLHCCGVHHIPGLLVDQMTPALPIVGPLAFRSSTKFDDS
jgi:hypothetical protein